MKLLKSVIVLTLIATVMAIALALVYQLTGDRIAEQAERTRLSTLNQILPPKSYDNGLTTDWIEVTAPAVFKTPEAVRIYRARQSGNPVAALFVVTAPDGYNGPIELLVGLWEDGTIAGVRVLSHRETPGLGDRMELSQSDWVHQFRGRSLGQPDYSHCAVERRGGVFDQFTGATITPSAIVAAIRRTLVYYQDHRARIFSQPSATEQTLP